MAGKDIAGKKYVVRSTRRARRERGVGAQNATAPATRLSGGKSRTRTRRAAEAACPAIDGVGVQRDKDCFTHNREAINYLLGNPNLRTGLVLDLGILAKRRLEARSWPASFGAYHNTATINSHSAPMMLGSKAVGTL